MTDSKWTPAPWKAYTAIDPTFRNLPERWEVSHERKDGSVRYVCKMMGFEPQEVQYESEANARLIAAAPDLAEACEAAELFMRDVGSHSKALELVRSALRKAKG